MVDLISQREETTKIKQPFWSAEEKSHCSYLLTKAEADGQYLSVSPAV